MSTHLARTSTAYAVAVLAASPVLFLAVAISFLVIPIVLSEVVPIVVQQVLTTVVPTVVRAVTGS